jgi:hypothetical protein
MTGAVDTYAAGTQQLIEDATRLGISWTLRPGTVTIADPLKVTFDGDDTPISAVSLVGMFPEGARVMGLLVPPGGNFIIGVADPTFTGPLGVTTNLNQAGTAGSTTSATFANMPGNPTLPFTKKYPASLTNLKAELTTGAFSSAINTGVAFALLIDGNDRQIMSLLINVAAAHVYFGSTILLTGLAANTYSAVGRWRRVSGAGTLQSDGNDWTSITLDEVWAV